MALRSPRATGSENTTEAMAVRSRRLSGSTTSGPKRDHRRRGGLLRLDHLAGDPVGVDNDRAAGCQHGRHRRLARAHAAVSPTVSTSPGDQEGTTYGSGTGAPLGSGEGAGAAASGVSGAVAFGVSQGRRFSGRSRLSRWGIRQQPRGYRPGSGSSRKSAQAAWASVSGTNPVSWRHRCSCPHRRRRARRNPAILRRYLATLGRVLDRQGCSSVVAGQRR